MNFKEAKDLGAVHYDGAPCKGCGNTLRYTSTYSCVKCLQKGATTLSQISADKQKEQELRNAAAKLGQQRYQGRDCLHAHGGLRYSTNGACVACRRMVEVTANDRKRTERLAQKERRKAPPVVRPNPTPEMDGWVSCIKPIPLSALMARK